MSQKHLETVCGMNLGKLGEVGKRNQSTDKNMGGILVSFLVALIKDTLRKVI